MNLSAEPAALHRQLDTLMEISKVERLLLGESQWFQSLFPNRKLRVSQGITPNSNTLLFYSITGSLVLQVQGEATSYYYRNLPRERLIQLLDAIRAI